MKIADSPNYSRKGQWWKAAGSSWFKSFISKLFVSRNRFKMKGNCALCVEVTTGSGSSLKEPAAAVSCGIKSWILTQKINLLLTRLFYNSTSELTMMQIWNQRNLVWNYQVKTIEHLQESTENPQKSGVLPPGKRWIYNAMTSEENNDYDWS